MSKSNLVDVMPYELFLALRYFRSRHKRRLARATALAAIVGIAMGVGALIVALALSNGFRDEMREKILQGTAHINVLRTDGLPIADSQTLKARISEIAGVVSTSSTTYDGAVAQGPKGSAYAVVRGIEQNAAESHALQSWLQEGSLPVQSNANSEPSAVIGIELANRLGLKRGDVLRVIPAGTNVSAANSMTRKLRVVGIFRSGLFEYDSTWIYLPVEIATSLSGENHAAAIISVQLRNPDDVKQIAEQVRQMLGNGYNTIDWQQANQPLFSALALERRMGLFIIGLIIAVAAINISTMLILVVVERRRDIAILSALGAKRRGVMLVFVIEGAIVGLAGALLGTVLGVAACAIGNYYKLVSLPADVYSISSVPLNTRVSEVVAAASAAFLLSVLATIYPARAAVKMRPTETFRDAG